jgi:hypothetical protein
VIMDRGHLLLQVVGGGAGVVVARRRSVRRAGRAGLGRWKSGLGDGLGRWVMAETEITAAASTFSAAALKSAWERPPNGSLAGYPQRTLVFVRSQEGWHGGRPAG